MEFAWDRTKTSSDRFTLLEDGSLGDFFQAKGRLTGSCFRYTWCCSGRHREGARKISERDKAGEGGRDTISPRLLLAVMISALFVSVFTNTMVNVAIPLIQDEFGVSEAQSGWVITGYALVFAVSIPLYGRI